MTTNPRKRGGVFTRANSAYPAASHIIDGGHDSRLSRRGQFIYGAALLGIVVIGFALIALAR
jgi:hypothetical protein